MTSEQLGLAVIDYIGKAGLLCIEDIEPETPLLPHVLVWSANAAEQIGHEIIGQLSFTAVLEDCAELN